MSIFMQKNLNLSNQAPSKFEKSIIKAILKKKKFLWDNSTDLDISILNKITSIGCFKRKEDQLKFVIKKCIKNMQNRFKAKLDLSDVEFLLKYPNYKALKDKYFYEFYFGHIAKERGISIENFFHFRTGVYRYSREIPNSVTKKSIGFWKLNPEFINEIKSYIDCAFLADFKAFNKKKIKLILGKWERIILHFGWEEGVKVIIKLINSRGCKLPWTLNEAVIAIRNTLEFID